MKTDQRVISPIDRDWGDPGAAAAAIKNWEKSTGLRLPDDYRAFMERFDGGDPYPNMIRYNVPLDVYPSTDPHTFVEPIFDWAYVIEQREGPDFADAIPPDMLPVAADPGGLTFLMSLRNGDHGSIHEWITSTSTWGTGNNSRTWPQAPSFRAFVESLFDDEEGIGYDHWYRPFKQKAARALEF